MINDFIIHLLYKYTSCNGCPTLVLLKNDIDHSCEEWIGMCALSEVVSKQYDNDQNGSVRFFASMTHLFLSVCICLKVLVYRVWIKLRYTFEMEINYQRITMNKICHRYILLPCILLYNVINESKLIKLVTDPNFMLNQTLLIINKQGSLHIVKCTCVEVNWIWSNETTPEPSWISLLMISNYNQLESKTQSSWLSLWFQTLFLTRDKVY